MLTELTIKDVKLRYINGYYDGMLSGVLEWEGKRYYFDIVDENNSDNINDADWYRKFGLYEMTPEEWATEDHTHAEFVKYVGSHYVINEDGKRDHSGLKPQSEWRKFYDQELRHVSPATKREPIAVLVW